MMDYASKFNDLGMYAPTIMADDTLKMHRFMKGLNSRIQLALAVYKPTRFKDLMGPSIQAKTDNQHQEEEIKRKHPFNGQSSQCG